MGGLRGMAYSVAAAAVIVAVSVGLRLAMVMAVVLVVAFTRALKQAKSRCNNCVCTWATCLQCRRHDRRWLHQLSEVRATFIAPFGVNDASWPL